MFETLKIRKNQGSQAIPDVTKAQIRSPFRGLPSISGARCGRCSVCRDICPVEAISAKPLSIDLGKCVFCGDCERLCPNKSITFSNYHKMASTSREYLVVDGKKNGEDYLAGAIAARKEINKIFGSSLKLRQVSAAGCNGCE